MRSREDGGRFRSSQQEHRKERRRRSEGRNEENEGMRGFAPVFLTSSVKNNNDSWGSRR